MQNEWKRLDFMIYWVISSVKTAAVTKLFNHISLLQGKAKICWKRQLCLVVVSERCFTRGCLSKTTTFLKPLNWSSYACLTLTIILYSDILILFKWKKSLIDIKSSNFVMTGFIGVIRTLSNVRDGAFCGNS